MADDETSAGSPEPEIAPSVGSMPGPILSENRATVVRRRSYWPIWAGLTLVLTCLSVLSTWLAMRGLDQVRHERRGRLVAEARYQQVLDGVHAAFDRADTQMDAWKSLGTALLMPDRGRPPDGAALERRGAAIAEAIRLKIDSLEPLHRATRAAGDQRAADTAMALVNQRAANILEQLGLIDDALPRLQAMKSMTDQLVREYPDDVELRELHQLNRFLLGRFYLNRVGDARIAQEYANEAVTLCQDRVARNADDPTAIRSLADSLALASAAATALEKYPVAETLSRDELRTRRTLPDSERKLEVSQRQESATLERLGELLLKQGKIDDARQQLDESFALRETLAQQSTDPTQALRELYLSLEQVGHAQMINRGEPKPARESYARAVAGFDKLFAGEGGVKYRNELATALYFLGTAELRSENREASDAAFRRCLELRRAEAADRSDLSAQIDLMIALGRCGEVDEASAIAGRLLSTDRPERPDAATQAACGLALCAAAERRAHPDNADAGRSFVDQALAALEKAAADHAVDRTTLALDPDLDAIREEPRFQALLEKVTREQSPAALRSPDA